MPASPTMAKLRAERDAWERFRDGFARSKRGNFYRRLPTGETVTVFGRGTGPDGEHRGYAWCVAGPDDAPRWSRERYRSEPAAMAALWRQVRRRFMGAEGV